jgi:hypothetical protein
MGRTLFPHSSLGVEDSAMGIFRIPFHEISPF